MNRLNLGGPTYNAAYLTKYLAPEFETMLLAGMKDDSEASSEFIIQNLGLKATYLTKMKRSINPIKDWMAYNEIKKVFEGLGLQEKKSAQEKEWQSGLFFNQKIDI